jgi:NADH-quinone oxidoreductase subunit K
MYIFDFSLFLYFIFTFFIANLLLIMVALDHFIIVLVFLDLLLLTSILLFIVHTLLTQNPIGYSYALVILGVAAADTAVGLGLFILFFKTTNNVSIKE